MEEAWIARLQTGTPMPAEHLETLDALRGMLSAIRDDLSEYEGTDDGGSSPSRLGLARARRRRRRRGTGGGRLRRVPGRLSHPRFRIEEQRVRGVHEHRRTRAQTDDIRVRAPLHRTGDDSASTSSLPPEAAARRRRRVGMGASNVNCFISSFWYRRYFSSKHGCRFRVT